MGQPITVRFSGRNLHPDDKAFLTSQSAGWPLFFGVLPAVVLHWRVHLEGYLTIRHGQFLEYIAALRGHPQTAVADRMTMDDSHGPINRRAPEYVIG